MRVPVPPPMSATCRTVVQSYPSATGALPASTAMVASKDALIAGLASR